MRVSIVSRFDLIQCRRFNWRGLAVAHFQIGESGLELPFCVACQRAALFGFFLAARYLLTRLLEPRVYPSMSGSADFRYQVA